MRCVGSATGERVGSWVQGGCLFATAREQWFFAMPSRLRRRSSKSRLLFVPVALLAVPLVGRRVCCWVHVNCPFATAAPEYSLPRLPHHLTTRLYGCLRIVHFPHTTNAELNVQGIRAAIRLCGRRFLCAFRHIHVQQGQATALLERGLPSALEDYDDMQFPMESFASKLSIDFPNTLYKVETRDFSVVHITELFL
ncbi:hypothetical protein IWX50DRAFT_623255 [Phyllosticta citricarpa]